MIICEEYFGGCPTCGQSDGYLDTGPSHWGLCREHGVKWFIGTNLFSSWNDQTVVERVDADAMLTVMLEVEPMPVGSPVPGAADATKATTEFLNRIGAA